MSPKYVDKEKTRSNLGSADLQLKFIEINSFFFKRSMFLPIVFHRKLCNTYFWFLTASSRTEGTWFTNY